MYGTVTRADQLRPLLRRFLIDTLGAAAAPGLDARPSVVLMLGVNGSGKTTTSAKLAAALKADGPASSSRPPTRSAPPPSSSCEIWGGASTSRSIRQAAGADPAAVVFDALKAAHGARRRRADRRHRRPAAHEDATSWTSWPRSSA